MKRIVLSVLSLLALTSATASASPVIVRVDQRAVKRAVHRANVNLVHAVNAMNAQLAASPLAIGMPALTVQMPGIGLAVPRIVLPTVTLPGITVAFPAPVAVEAPPPAPALVMDEGSFNALLAAIGAETFENQKLEILRSATASTQLAVAHLARLIPLFTFENNKVAVVEMLAPRTVDKHEAYRLAALFTFNNSKSRVLDLMR